MPRLLLATGNPGKVREFRDLLDGCGWQLVTPAEAGLEELEVEETGSSYAENARIKAIAYAEASGLPAIADDSGLEVDGLGGEPGPLHHVRGWDGADNAERLAIILGRAGALPPAQRRCRYRAVIVVAFPDGRTFDSAGVCEGVLAETATGANGFGYDPLFFVPSAGKMMAELSPAEKNQISHRAAAARAICPKLREAATAGRDPV